jgi:hypothetical protein
MNKTWWQRFNVIRTIDGASDEGGSAGDPPQTPEAEPKTEPEPEGADDENLGEGGVKALKAEREANKAAKAELAELQAKLKTFEDKDKTEAEKQAEKLASLEKSSTENALKAQRYEVAAEAGLPLKLAGRIRGDDHDSMLADAKELLSYAGDKPHTPKPDPSQGKGGIIKPASLSEAIAAHYK